MSTTTTTRRQRTLGGAPAISAGLIAAGVWLLMAWAVLDYEQAQRAVFVDVAAGITLTTLGLLSLRHADSHRLWVAVAWAGTVLTIAPFALQYGDIQTVLTAYVNHAVIGLIVLAIGVWGAKKTST